MNESKLDFFLNHRHHVGSICVTAWPANVKFSMFNPEQGFVGGYANGLNTILNESITMTDNLGVTTPYGDDWVTSGGQILVHEFGHMMNLGHAACGVAADDVNVGYPDGRIGTNGGGYDTGRNFYFTTAGGQFSDFMSYCNKNWTSDLNYRQVINTQRTDSVNPVPRARVAGSHSHDHNITSPTPAKQHLGFYRRDGGWVMKLVDIDPSKLKPFNGKQRATGLHPVLNGLSLKSVHTHFGQPETGPFFIPATSALKALIQEGRLP